MKIYYILIFIPVFLFSSRITSFAQISYNAKEIVRKSDEKMRGKTSKAELTIQIVRPTWTREIKMKTWSKGNNYALILVIAPSKEKGTVFLKRDKEVWNWIPSIERTIKLPPSMMSQSWMGTDFTNDDLVKESSVVEDYIHSFEGDSVIEGRDCYKIKLIPTPEAAVVWGKILVWIDKKDDLQLRTEFYDEENVLISTMQSSEIKMMDGRLIPTRTEMIPADKKNQKTLMIFTNIVFDKSLDENIFSPNNMKKAN